jgi:hypothetical protein
VRKTDQNKKMNNFLFIFYIILFLFYCLFFFSFLRNEFIAEFGDVWMFILLLLLYTFMLTGGTIYGFITHEKMKAAFLGVLFPVMSGFFNILHIDLIRNSSPIYEFILFSLIGLLCGPAGFFAANTQSDRLKRYFLYLLSFICLISGLWLFLERPAFF